MIFSNTILTLWPSIQRSKLGETKTIMQILQKRFLEEVLTDALGFAGSVIIRRILGIAHVIDFETISDQERRCECLLSSIMLSHLSACYALLEAK